MLALALTASFLPTAGAQESREQAVERRVNELLGQMTLEEKVGQLNLISHGPPLRWEDISEGKAGALLNFNSAQDVARAQALARQSRLKIPPLFGLDVLHGFRTQSLGRGCSVQPARLAPGLRMGGQGSGLYRRELDLRTHG
jgi:beta-glucosidase